MFDRSGRCLGMTLAVLAMALAMLAARPAVAEKMSDAAAARVANQVAASLDRIETMVADFDMLTTSGLRRGQIFLNRREQALRMQFARPLNHLLLVNGPATFFFGGDGTEVRTATRNTPLAFLLDPVAALRNDVQVLQAEERGGTLFLALAQKSDKQAGQVILQLTGKPNWRVLNWGAYDKDGRFTQTTLRNVETGLPIDPALFALPER